MAGKRKAAGSGPTGPTGTAPTKTVSGKAGAKPVRLKRNGKPKKQRTLAGKVRRVLFYLLMLGLVFGLIGALGFLYLYNTTKLPNANADFETETSFVYYSNGETEVGQFAIQNRDAISYDEMPQDIKDAAIAAENRTFWTDSGIDFRGILRAAFSNASGNATQGASTITQQYIKILYLTQERSYQRKLKEAILSLKLQRQISKQEILEGYLNTIYFGRGAYGVQAAAQAFFDKPAAELTLQESAALASVINNPSNLDPANGKDARQALKQRYAYVLDGMAQTGDITADEAEEAARKLPKFRTSEAESTYGGQKGHVLTMVKDQLLQLTNESTGAPFTESEIDGGGLQITTTFTKKAMDAAEQGVLAVKPTGPELDQELHVGVASVQVDTGAVRGIYGGQDYLDSQINWAVAGGMGGSSLKPFALTAGIEAGYSLRDTFDGNSPLELENGDEVENQGDESYGSAVNLITATENSINTAFVDLTTSIPDGPEKVMETMNAMGIPPAKAPAEGAYGFPTSSPGLEPFPAIALGSATVSPINMANGYATIANGGRFHAPYIIEKVVGRDGETLYDHSVSDEQVIEPAAGVEDGGDGEEIASDVSYAMQQVVESGSGFEAQALGRPAAGKTGTATVSNGDVSSSWFTGFTPQLATSVMYVRGKGTGKLDGWLPASSDGRDGYFGGNYPAKTWTEIMIADMDGVEEEDFPEPAYVDGEAPDDGHVPTYAPAPTTQAPPPTRQPTNTGKPTDDVPQPTIPTPTPTTQAPPPTTQAPPPTTVAPPPTTVAPPPTTEVPPTTQPPTTTPPATPGTPAPSRALAWWARMFG